MQVHTLTCVYLHVDTSVMLLCFLHLLILFVNHHIYSLVYNNIRHADHFFV